MLVKICGIKDRAALDAAWEAGITFLDTANVYGQGVSESVIGTWLKWKREKEIDPMRLRPHPYEFCLYYDA